jgi:signal peptidase I
MGGRREAKPKGQAVNSIHEPMRHDGPLTAVKSILEIIVCALFVVAFIVQPFRIPSASMEPTLRVGDFLLVDKQSFAPAGILDRLLPPTRIERGDLVVFHYPVDLSLHLVKRVVGVPGDRLRLRQGRVLVNGQPLAEPYAFYSTSLPNGFRDDFPSLLEADPSVDLHWWIELRRATRGGEITVPPGQYFVLGDNRNDSEDSRYWGFVPQRDIVGRPLLVYFSLPVAEDTSDDTPLERLRDTFKHGIRSWRVLR